jgi:hypothetical protein
MRAPVLSMIVGLLVTIAALEHADGRPVTYAL